MAHPRREAMVAELTAALDRPAEVVWDQINDRHDTGIRAIEAYDPTCTHHLVVQDDVTVCRDLLAGVERALRYIPQDVPMSLYVGRVKPFAREVQAAVNVAGEASWITMQGIYWGPGIVLPTAHIEKLSVWYRQSRVTNYDRRVSTWYAKRNAKVWYSWPSLVDHRDAESLVPGHGRRRCAHRFLGEHASALDVDWTGGVIDLADTKRMDRRRQSRTRQVA